MGPPISDVAARVRGRLVLADNRDTSAPRPSVAVLLYAGSVAVVAVAAAWWMWSPVRDLPTLVVGATATVGIAALSVDTITGLNIAWSSAVFMHLGLSLALGAPGAVVASAADGIADAVLFRTGSLKATFNTSVFLLANLSAIALASRIGEGAESVLRLAMIGSGVGLSSWSINYGLTTIVVSLATKGRVSVAASLRDGISALPYHLAYGWAAVGVALLYRQAGVFGFTMLVAPVAAAQVFLFRLARQTRRHAADIRMAEERERRRIARDLHDTVVQVVSGWSMELAAKSGSSSGRPDISPSLKTTLKRASDDLRVAASELRTLIVEIAPPELGTRGVAPVLRDLTGTVAEAGMTATCDAAESVDLDQRARELLFRVAREALRNIRAHSGATTVHVGLRQDDLSVTLTVDDNGRGFTEVEAEHRSAVGHVGLRGLHEAAAEQDAGLVVESAPSQGTHVRLTIPRSSI